MSLATLMRRGALRATAASAPPAPVAREVPAVLPGVADDPEISPSDLDRWSWPKSDAMNKAEIDRRAERLSVFMRRGLGDDDANRLADALVMRDREADDRRVCLECSNLRGRSCAQPVAAGMGRNVEQFALILQRCPAFQTAA